MSAINHVSLAFARFSDEELAEFALGVYNGLTAAGAAFANPPIPYATFQTDVTAFQNAIEAAADGGKALTTAKNAARETVVADLRQLAEYVQSVTNGDPTTVVSVGFQVNTSGHSPSQPLSKPGITAILSEVSGQLALRVTPIDNAKSYEVQNGTVLGTWQPAVTSPSARKIIVPNLTPGTTYYFRVRAIGGSTGASDWSDSVSRMAS